MKRNLPEKRPTDNVKLGVDLPQEDEFALGNITPNSFYHFFYFPHVYQKYYRTAIVDVNNGNVKGWDQAYRKLVVKALLDTNGKRAVLKNPVNTARIPSLLRIFPDARFIFIYRNPVIVFLSTRHFFYELFPALWFYPESNDGIDKMIFENFRRIMADYELQKSNIPAGNLKEIKFEDFEKDPVAYCREIYADLLHEEFEKVRIHFENYLLLQKGYSKNKYHISKSLANRIRAEWGSYMTAWDYVFPEELIIDPE